MSELQRRQALVDHAAATLIRLLEAMADYERAPGGAPQKWDEEYAAHAVNDCVDRLFCAPDGGMPKASESLSAEYRRVRALAAPFLDEDVPLPGSVEERTLERALALYAERWPERVGPLPFDLLRHDDPFRIAIWAEAERDIAAMDASDEPKVA